MRVSPVACLILEHSTGRDFSSDSKAEKAMKKELYPAHKYMNHQVNLALFELGWRIGVVVSLAPIPISQRIGYEPYRGAETVAFEITCVLHIATQAINISSQCTPSHAF